MPVSFNHNYGKFALDCNNHRGVDLVSDGKTLAMQWDGHSFFMGGFSVTSMQIEHTTQSDSGARSGYYTRRGETGRIVHIELSSVGPVQIGPASAFDNIFRNANDLSVDELLKLAYQKIDARAEEEDIITNTTEAL